MSIQITGKHMEVGESLSNFAKDSLNTLVNHYIGNTFTARIVISKDHHQFLTDISLHISKTLIVHCKGEDIDAYKSITMAIHQLENRIKRYRNRLRDRKRHNHIEEEVMMGKQYILNHRDEEEENIDNPLIIAEMNNEIHKLSVGEVVMQLDLTDSPLLLFQNAANGRINVVYRRADGNIGWIDPALK